MSLIELEGVSKIYGKGDIKVVALSDINLSIEEGEFVSVMGPSGSGKSTLLNLLGCLDYPSSGTYHLDGKSVEKMGEDELAGLRNRILGFVFQTYNLLPRMSALENVALPLIYRGVETKERKERAQEALEIVGLEDRVDHKPSELSGGQQQRVAIARAVVGRPRILLADEATGDLDSKTGEQIMELFEKLRADFNITVIQVTHDRNMAKFGERLVRLRDGIIESDEEMQEAAVGEI